MIKKLICICMCITFLCSCGSINLNQEIIPTNSPAPTLSEEIKTIKPVEPIEEIKPSLEPLPTEPTPSSLPAPSTEPTEPFEYKGFIELIELDPSFIIDCKYATEDNFTGEIQYEFPLVLVRKDVAEQLVKAQELFKADGYTMKIFDIYRPMRVQQSLYDATPDHLKIFVAKPSKNAKHCKGIAVDCSLVDVDGNEVSMPSTYDEFNESAYTDFKGGTDEQRKMRDYFIETMTECGFTVYSKEWWHFDAPNKDEYDALDMTFAEFIEARNQMRDSEYK